MNLTRIFIRNKLIGDKLLTIIFEGLNQRWEAFVVLVCIYGALSKYQSLLNHLKYYRLNGIRDIEIDDR